VFHLALPLALSAISPTAPAASVVSGAVIGVCFSPAEDCASFAIQAIGNAEREILVSGYALTAGSSVVEALGAQRNVTSPTGAAQLRREPSRSGPCAPCPIARARSLRTI